MTTDTQFLNTKEVAEILGVHQKTVHQWLRTGRLSGTKISYRAWRIPRSALEDFIEQNSNTRPKITSDKAINIKSSSESSIPKETDTTSVTGMKHYIREIMGENNQTNNK